MSERLPRARRSPARCRRPPARPAPSAMRLRAHDYDSLRRRLQAHRPDVRLVDDVWRLQRPEPRVCESPSDARRPPDDSVCGRLDHEPVRRGHGDELVRVMVASASARNEMRGVDEVELERSPGLRARRRPRVRPPSGGRDGGSRCAHTERTMCVRWWRCRWRYMSTTSSSMNGVVKLGALDAVELAVATARRRSASSTHASIRASNDRMRRTCCARDASARASSSGGSTRKRSA